MSCPQDQGVSQPTSMHRGSIPKYLQAAGPVRASEAHDTRVPVIVKSYAREQHLLLPLNRTHKSCRTVSNWGAAHPTANSAGRAPSRGVVHPSAWCRRVGLERGLDPRGGPRRLRCVRAFEPRSMRPNPGVTPRSRALRLTRAVAGLFRGKKLARAPACCRTNPSLTRASSRPTQDRNEV